MKQEQYDSAYFHHHRSYNYNPAPALIGYIVFTDPKILIIVSTPQYFVDGKKEEHHSKHAYENQNSTSPNSIFIQDITVKQPLTRQQTKLLPWLHSH